MKAKTHKKFIDIGYGEAQLFQKYKNRNSLINNTNTNFRRKINSKNNKANSNFRINKTNQLINHLNLNEKKNTKDEDLYINKNKPIRLKYNNKKNDYDEINEKIYDKYNDNKKENEYDSDNINNKEELIQEKINKFKTKFDFKGNNEDFIKYLNIVKIKTELVNLIEMIANNGKKINQENAEECFNKLEQFIEFKNNEKRNALKVYQYLVDKLLEINNLDKNDILREFW